MDFSTHTRQNHAHKSPLYSKQHISSTQAGGMRRILADFFFLLAFLLILLFSALLFLLFFSFQFSIFHFHFAFLCFFSSFFPLSPLISLFFPFCFSVFFFFSLLSLLFLMLPRLCYHEHLSFFFFPPLTIHGPVSVDIFEKNDKTKLFFFFSFFIYISSCKIVL
jgi:hypothetical protein